MGYPERVGWPAEEVAELKEAGLSDDDIAGIERGELTDELDRAVMAAVDELHHDSVVSDATWAALSTDLDEQQLMDLIFTIGCYGALAMAINSFGVQPDSNSEPER